ncbi:MAG: 16S rRNA (guanine(527)-N(7))-methyltransferase RsmG [Desulfobacterales bacterium]|nr:16S rRNA (guanine(527)-N(7))-methyltransferase RsmG [Desulfobacterales bacterium]
MNAADWKALLKDGAAVLGLRLNAFQMQSFYVHMREMQHWNRRINLTAITAPEEIAIKHYLDAIAPSGQIPDQARLLDVGSGAGFPGIPLKIARPGCHLTMIDRARKRVSFLRHVVRQLELDQVTVHHARIETLARIPGAETQFDCVVSRAFTRAADLARMVLPLLHGGAALMMWKGPDIHDELDALAALSDSLETPMSIETHAYRLPSLNAGRHLISVRIQGTGLQAASTASSNPNPKEDYSE